MSIRMITVARITCGHCQWYEDVHPDEVDAQFIAGGGSWFRISSRTYCDWTCKERGEASLATMLAEVQEAARQAQTERDLRNAHKSRHTV